ncbi:restriction endonuclease [Mesoaciditoga sp.]
MKVIKLLSIVFFIIGASFIFYFFANEENFFFVESYVPLFLRQVWLSSLCLKVGLAFVGLGLLFLLIHVIYKKTVAFKLKVEFYKLQGNGDGKAFEIFLTKLFKACGWKVQNPTSSTNSSDQGVDLILNGKVAVQAKNYARSTGNDAVQEVMAGATYWKNNGFPSLKRKAVVTTSYFTRQAIDLAKSGKVILKDGKDIEELLNGKLRKKWILRTSKKF